MSPKLNGIALLLLAASWSAGAASARASVRTLIELGRTPGEHHALNAAPAARPPAELATSAPSAEMNAKLSAVSSENAFDAVTIRDDGIYYGPPIVGGAYQPDAYQSQSSYPTFIRNYLSLGYNVTSRWLVGAAFVSDVFPNGQTYLAPMEGSADKYMAVDDSFIRAMAPKLIDTGHLRMSADFRLYAPTSYLSRDLSGQGFSFQGRFIPNYSFPGSRWSVGAVIKDTYYLNHYAWASGPNGAMINDAYFGPLVNYQVSPSVAVGLFAEFETERYVGNPGFFDYTVNNPENPTPWDLEPNVSWDVTPRINLNPFLQIYPGGKIAWDQVQIGALFGMKLY